MPAKPEAPGFGPPAVDDVIRDLTWVARSPSFIAGPDVAPPLLAPGEPMPEVDRELLSTFMAERTSHRVGYYFEALLTFWLEHVRGVEIVGAGVQVRDGKRTVGELDLVFRDEHGVLTHWEVSVKFFLHHPNDDGSHYPGPNARDNFERKMARLFDHQLPLSITHMPEVDLRQALVKGMVFHHPLVPPPTTLPAGMAEDHGKGLWIRASELEILSGGPWESGHIAMKPWWLAASGPAQFVPIGDLVEELRRHFHHLHGVGHPVMLMLEGDGVTEKNDRAFVVGDQWPLHHEA